LAQAFREKVLGRTGQFRGSKPKPKTNYAANRALAQAFRERLAGARGQSPRIKAQSQNAQRTIRAKQNPANKKARQ